MNSFNQNNQNNNNQAAAESLPYGWDMQFCKPHGVSGDKFYRYATNVFDPNDKNVYEYLIRMMPESPGPEPFPHFGLLKKGFYCRVLVGAAELQSVQEHYPTFRMEDYGNVQHEADYDDWTRVFLVDDKFIYSVYCTNALLVIQKIDQECEYNGGCQPVATGNGVYKRLLRFAKNHRRSLRQEKETVDEEMKFLNSEILVRRELCRVRDMDRTQNLWTYTGGAINLCTERACYMYRCCVCRKCIVHCPQNPDCTLPRSLWEESKMDREYVTKRRENIRNKRKRDCEKQSRAERIYQQIQNEISRAARVAESDPSGPAHSWFIPDKFTHDFNFNLPFLEPFVESLNTVNASVPWTKVLKDFGFLIAHLMASKSKATTTLAVTHFITQLPLVDKVINQFLAKIPGWFECNAQAAGVEGLFVPLLTLLGVTITTLGIGKLPDDKSISGFIMRLSKIGACIKSLEVMKDYIQPTAEIVVDYIRVNFFGYSSADMNAWKSYNDYCDEIQALNNSGFEERLKTEKELVIKIDDLLIRGDGLMKTLDQLRVPAMQRTRFNASYAWLGRMRTEAAHCPAGKHIPRVPPVIFHFIGKTGVGKSEVTNLINARLLASLGHTDPNDLWTKVYYRDCGQERFDGYNNGVEGVVVDDFGSRVDSAANPSSEPFEAIRMQNSAVWQLPMASLAEKGSTFFRAKYVIWTSNRSSFKFESITNPEAVLRRVSLKFEQRPRPEFTKIGIVGREAVEMLDNMKVDEAAKTNPDVYDDVWLFNLIDPQEEASPADADTGGVKVLRRDMTFDEVAEMCEKALRTAQVVGNKKLAHTAAYFKKCVENQGKAQSGLDCCGPAHGCDWFGLFGRDARSERNEEAWNHTNLRLITEDFKFLGEAVGPAPFELKQYDGPRRPEHEIYQDQLCFQVKGSKKVMILFARAVVQANTVCEAARQMGWNNNELRELFGRVVFSFNVRPARVKLCDQCTFQDKCWEKLDQLKKQGKAFVKRQWDKLPCAWKYHINEAFEFAIALFERLLIVFVVMMGLEALSRVFVWLFPSMDPERQRLLDFYEEVIYEIKCYDDREVPFQLVIARKSLEDALGMDSVEIEKFSAEIERKYRTLLAEVRNHQQKDAREEFWNSESHQMKTTGVSPTNVESHQDKTAGAKVKNVESHQERTQGTRVRNTESHQEQTKGVVVKNVEGRAEATNDQNAMEVAYKVRRNVYGIQVIGDGGNYFVGNLVFIVGKIAVTNRHIHKLIKGKEIRLFNESSKRGFVITKEQTEAMPMSTMEEGIHGNKDIVMVEMPRHCLVHADITPYFMTKQDFGRHYQIDSVCVLGYGNDLQLQHRYSNQCQAIDKIDFRLVEADSTETLVREWFRYGVHSRPGDCGSVAIAHDASATRKILGLHMAGYDSEGYFGVAVAVHQDLLKELRAKLNVKNAESDLNGEFALEGEETERSFGDFVSYGKAMAKAGSSQTVIKPGPAFGILAEPKTAPARLRPFYQNGEIVDPLEMARKKADTPNVPVDEKTLKQCSQHYSQLLMDLKKDERDDRVLTWEEAIRGREDDEWYSPVKRNTSPGYGWEASGRGKEPWLGSGEEYICDHPEVLAKRDEMMKRIREGKRASTVFVDTLKDERRPLSRVEAGKTRLFAAGEMTYCLLFRQYFAGFNAHIMRNCIMAESTVGINVFGEQWSTLANRLKEMGPNVVAGDFSNYDGTLCSAVIWEVLDVIERFYENATDEDRKVRRALWCEIVNSVHLTTPFDGTAHGKEGFLYQWSHSQPSGNPATVILNSVYHSLVTRYVYKLCARKYCPEKVSLNNWDKYVRHVNYGDDDVTNIAPEIEWFNQLTMTEAFLELGMVYTDEAKSGQLVKFRTLEEVGFLKRKFRYDQEQGRWRCPHSMDVILEMAMWVKRGANVYQLTADVLEEAMHELAQHPEEVFNHYLPVFMEARKKIISRWPCTFLTYDEYAEVDMARLGWLVRADIRAEREVELLFNKN